MVAAPLGVQDPAYRFSELYDWPPRGNSGGLSSLSLLHRRWRFAMTDADGPETLFRMNIRYAMLIKPEPIKKLAGILFAARGDVFVAEHGFDFVAGHDVLA